FWGTHHLSLDLGAEVHLWGPDFGGKASLDLYVTSVTVHFGAKKSQKPPPLDWATFRETFLPEPLVPQVITLDSPSSPGSGHHLGTFHPHELTLNVEVPVPLTQVENQPVGIVPMGLQAGDFTSTLEVSVYPEGQPSEPLKTQQAPLAKKVPAALWAPHGQPTLSDEALIEAIMGQQITLINAGVPIASCDARECGISLTNISPKKVWEESTQLTGNPKEAGQVVKPNVTDLGKAMLKSLGLTVTHDLSEPTHVPVEILAL
ncbi:MAG: DUF6603 domain-containing protein, partial [Bacteroidota bacterium]